MPARKIHRGNEGRPKPDATETDILAFTRAWVLRIVEVGFASAIAELDERADDDPGGAWSQAIFDEVLFEDLAESDRPELTDPSEVEGLYVRAFPFEDGTGFYAYHDLAFEGRAAGFRLQLSFTKVGDAYRILLEDLHDVRYD